MCTCEQLNVSVHKLNHYRSQSHCSLLLLVQRNTENSLKCLKLKPDHSSADSLHRYLAALLSLLTRLRCFNDIESAGKHEKCDANEPRTTQTLYTTQEKDTLIDFPTRIFSLTRSLEVRV